MNKNNAIIVKIIHAANGWGYYVIAKTGNVY